MSSFTLGLVLGLFAGGFLGMLALALVTASSGQRFPRRDDGRVQRPRALGVPWAHPPTRHPLSY